ncbi:MAG: serine hydrolase [Chitinophagales bacterium]|nr:serine hydrolase [Chitinophagales bacterium]MDW8427117.1 glycoside hydrolase family 3 N-terminal domain-containing protein [Chitinophagales bacterium]
MRRWGLVVFAAGVFLTLAGRAAGTLPPFLQADSRWADSVLSTLTLEQKIGQLFIIACASENVAAEQERVGSLISRYHIGGIIFMKGGPARQLILTNYFQQISSVPLLIGMDAEWGPAMRLDSIIAFPRPLALGAAADTLLAYRYGQMIGRQLKRLGVHLNFAPVVDVNSNPRNPVIGDRSFGEHADLVALLGAAYMRGLQDEGILACAKHFPGHGNTDEDSHLTLPVVQQSIQQLHQHDLPPFKELIGRGVSAVMTAHISVPALDSTSQMPASLSRPIVSGLLRQQMEFRGLVITDALNMKGVRMDGAPGEVELLALLAGNDILLFSEEVEAAVARIRQAIETGIWAEAELNTKVRRILQAKSWCGAHRKSQLSLDGLMEQLNHADAWLLQHQVVQRGLILVADAGGMVPLKRLDTMRIATLAFSDTGLTAFQQALDLYAPVHHFFLRPNASPRALARLELELQPYNVVLVALFTTGRMGNVTYGLNAHSRRLLDSLRRRCTLLVTAFGNVFAASDIEDFPYVMLAMEKHASWQRLAAQAWFGGTPISGRLPVSISARYPFGTGHSTAAIRLRYSRPEAVGLSSSYFERMDSVIRSAILQKAFPGAQLWIAKDGEVIWHKAYGSYVYDAYVPVTQKTLYDLASLTKIAATTLAVMKLSEEGSLDLNAKVAEYLPEFRNSNKGRIRIAELLAHESGLQPFIAFHEAWLKSDQWDPKIFSRTPHDPFTVTVMPGMYMNTAYIDSIWKRIEKSPLSGQGRYVYSDLGFYFLQRIVECLSGQSLDQYVYQQFYRPLGLQTMSFVPLRFFGVDRIAPSSFDARFRKQVLQGSVHDPGAALLGGVAGHAGLFANANDVGILMSMLLNKGSYGGRRYLDSITVLRFTQQYSERSRRGLGFDKPELQADRPSPTARQASSLTFGHTGFTGTCAWADPKYQIVYVFLSNRTFPDDQNKRINTLNVRVRLQELIYEALDAAESK